MRSAVLFAPILGLALWGCKGGSDSDVDTDVVIPEQIGTDADSDGVTVDDGDCDDANAAIFPGADELCDGKDDNCNGTVDEGLADVDLDGICNAMDAETCDGMDNNGDGVTDEGFGDGDGDGTADCADGEECDGKDNNGDGTIDEGYDADGDSYTQCGGDCDDADASVNPGKTENDTNKKDDDCDGFWDEGTWAAGDVFITEIMNNPSRVSDPEGEWFEVYNASSRTVLLNGLMLESEGVTHQISSKSVIQVAAGGYAVIALQTDRTKNGGVETVAYGYSDVSLGNESGDLSVWVMKGATKVTIDSVNWSEAGGYPLATKGSMSLEPTKLTAAENDTGSNWCEAPSGWGSFTDYGSPAGSNGLCKTFDHDGDGYSGDDGDCNDADATVYPGAVELSGTVDEDCDGVAEVGPVASAKTGTGSSTKECGTIILDGTGTKDNDGPAPISYLWELTSAPSTSKLTSADITNPTSATAGFEPDDAGTYVFSLSVSDAAGAKGKAVSLSVTVTATTGSTTPSVDAGSNQSASATAECVPLSYGTGGFDCASCASKDFTVTGTATGGTGSYDYAWSVSSGTASISDAARKAPVITVPAPKTENGKTNSTSVIMSVKATDCMGATSTADTVTLSYSCTGT